MKKIVLPDNIYSSVAVALQEDIRGGDITASLIQENVSVTASVICRESATIAGIAWFIETFQQVDIGVKITWHVCDGETVTANQKLCTLNGSACSILTAERTALNFLQTLSATATETAKYVNAIAHTSCKVLDTRKTIPGLRHAQKYAVVCGGGKNHRKGLYDGFLIKENHIMAAGSIAAAVAEAKKNISYIPVEVEVENLDELAQALKSGADIVLLDNMQNDMLKQAVSINWQFHQQHNAQEQTKLEASGGVTLQSIGAIAETGVDFISVGNITKNIQAIDLSMRFN